MNLLLLKRRSLLKVDVGWARAGLGGVLRLEVLEQSCDLRLQLESVKVGGKRDYFTLESRF